MVNNYLRPGDPASLLTATRRRRDRDALAGGQVVDVLVVGGGVSGVGVALDAATRGLSVALIEADDFAFGTSRWSSKLVHGGLRYLAKGQVGIAWESAVERARIMTTIAPHLVRSLAGVLPVLEGMSGREQKTIIAGLRAGDMLRKATRMPRSVLPPPRRVGPQEALRMIPTLPADRLRGAYVGWDGQLEDDARLVVAIARTAAAYGALMLTKTAAIEISADGAVVEDRLDGGMFTIKARHVINATGVWAGTLDNRVRVMPSRGTHVVVRSHDLGHPTGSLTVPVPGHFARYVFAMPQPDDLVYIGLTDVSAPGPIPDVPTATEDEIDWILSIISLGLARPLERRQVVGTFAGLRPLVTFDGDDDNQESSDISRKHLVLGGPGEVVTLVGGKLTTYRRMAQDAVDRICDIDCRTQDLPLIGAGRIQASNAVPPRLVRRYGDEAPLIAALAEHNPSLLQPITPPGSGHDVDVRGVELLWGIEAEGALTQADLLERRTRISLVPADLELVAPVAAEIVGTMASA
ncbi:MAG: glycerol-3-phosphate dehydrogenase/oxidase [Actinomycetes bacterium]